MHLSYRHCKKNKCIPEAKFVRRAVVQKKREKEQAVDAELQIQFTEWSCNRNKT